MSHNLSDVEIIILTPEKRIQQLSMLSSKIELNTNIAARKYYRSGREMINMANVYLKENNLEQAYILYMRFMTLFLDTINDHPDCENVPIEERNLNYRALRDVFPKTEYLRTKLLEQYGTEYELYREQKALKRIKQRHDHEMLMKENGDMMPYTNTDTVTQEQLNNILDNAATPELNNSYFQNNSTSIELRSPNYNFINFSKSNDSTLTLSMPSQIQFIQNTKPLLNKSTSYNLRQMIVPSDLIKKFLECSNSNTNNDEETCGILAGNLSSNCLTITHLMIPKQSGTSDSCVTMNEEDIFDFQDKQDIITLGWIHTHPSQSPFMSSADLHIHYSYQLMIPEAIAVVCAPKYKESNFFVLTPYHGLQVIADCKLFSGFHTHTTDGDIYTVAEHYVLDNSLSVNVVDFR